MSNKQPKETYNGNISAYELMSLGTVSGMINIEDLAKYSREEVFDFAKTIDPDKQFEILSRIYRLKEIRLKLFSYRELQQGEKQPTEMRRKINERVAGLELQLQSLLDELSEDATPENKEIYVKYLKVLLEVDEIYRDVVAPLRKALHEKESERNLLTHQIVRSPKELQFSLEDLRNNADAEVEELKSQLDKYVGQDGYRELYNLERLDYLMDIRRQLDDGKFVELEGLREEIEFIKHAMRINEPVMLVGDLGSGKTEALKHAAKLHLIEKGRLAPEEYRTKSILVFSGSKESSIYDLMGKMKIKHQNLTIEDRVKKMRKELSKMGYKIEEEDSSRVEIEMALQAYESGWTYSEFAYGVISQAIRNGEPIIIDEIDQIPAEILSRINDLMTLKSGDKWRIQENGEEEIEIPEGFIILATANLKSKRYKSREELDAAFASRFIVREHDYLGLADTYDLIMGYFANTEIRSLRPDIPDEAFTKFPALVVAMKEIQDIFQGKFKTTSLFEAGGVGATRHIELEKTTFSTRTLVKILDFWVKTGMGKITLNEAIGTVLLSPVNKKDQQYLLDIMLRFGFFEGWNAKDFKKKLSIDIDQSKLDTLQGALTSDIGRQEQREYPHILEEANKRMQDTMRVMGYVKRVKNYDQVG